VENVPKATAGSYFPAMAVVVRAVRVTKRVVIGCMMAKTLDMGVSKVEVS
jgi:hypothetical protein